VTGTSFAPPHGLVICSPGVRAQLVPRVGYGTASAAARGPDCLAAAERDRMLTRGNVGGGLRVKRGVRPKQWRCRMAKLPPPPEGIVLTRFIVSDDVERSRRFYTEVLGGRVAFPGDPVNVALANSWIVINGGGGPTDDKPTVTLETPRDPDRVSSFLNIRVKDIEAVYAEWSARGAEFLTPPKQHQFEKRCYIRDPDGHLIEVGQTTDPAGDWSPAHWPSSAPAEESE
jgi:catechol 2,3-dioxygenase-like lactoylglutathione lyase family enzyme